MADEVAVSVPDISNVPPGGAPAAVAAPAPAAPVAPIALATAPVAVPVAPVALAVAPADTGEAVTYDPTGDPGLDVALSFVGALGLRADHPSMVAAGKGDFALLEAHLATMGDKAVGWQQIVALAKQSHTNREAEATAKAGKVQAAVHSIAGSAEAWTEIQAWASINADPAEKEELNALFEQGVMGARAAARLIVDAYNSAKGTVVNPAQVTSNTPGAQALAPTSGPLSEKDYAAAVRVLHKQLGGRMDASPEYAALRARLRR